MQTDNPTLITKGEAKNDVFNFVKWHKFNQSSLDYDLVGGKTFVKAFGATAYDEPMVPHIMIDRNHQATLLISNVRKEDEGTYKIEYSVQLDGTLLAYQEFNVSVLGKVLCARGFCNFTLIVKWVSWVHLVFKLRKKDLVFKLGINKCIEYLSNYLLFFVIVKPGL